jgi:hypothetical protein
MVTPARRTGEVGRESPARRREKKGGMFLLARVAPSKNEESQILGVARNFFSPLTVTIVRLGAAYRTKSEFLLL